MVASGDSYGVGGKSRNTNVLGAAVKAEALRADVDAQTHLPLPQQPPPTSVDPKGAPQSEAALVKPELGKPEPVKTAPVEVEEGPQVKGDVISRRLDAPVQKEAPKQAEPSKPSQYQAGPPKLENKLATLLQGLAHQPAGSTKAPISQALPVAMRQTPGLPRSVPLAVPTSVVEKSDKSPDPVKLPLPGTTEREPPRPGQLAQADAKKEEPKREAATNKETHRDLDTTISGQSYVIRAIGNSPQEFGADAGESDSQDADRAARLAGRITAVPQIFGEGECTIQLGCTLGLRFLEQGQIREYLESTVTEREEGFSVAPLSRRISNFHDDVVKGFRSPDVTGRGISA